VIVMGVSPIVLPAGAYKNKSNTWIWVYGSDTVTLTDESGNTVDIQNLPTWLPPNFTITPTNNTNRLLAVKANTPASVQEFAGFLTNGGGGGGGGGGDTITSPDGSLTIGGSPTATTIELTNNYAALDGGAELDLSGSFPPAPAALSFNNAVANHIAYTFYLNGGVVTDITIERPLGGTQYHLNPSSNTFVLGEGDLLNVTYTTVPTLLVGFPLVSASSIGAVPVSLSLAAFGTYAGSVSAPSDKYAAINGPLDASFGNVANPVPLTCTIRNLTAIITNNTLDNNCTVTLVKGPIPTDTALTFTVASGFTGNVSDLVHSASFNAGDYIAMHIDCGASSSGQIQLACSVEVAV
jgi:hypothetical protein